MGYRVTEISALEPGIIRSIRRPLELTAFGANAVVLPEGTEWFNHFHHEQDELYFVHQGTAIFDVGGEQFEVKPGGVVHVQSTTPRDFWNAGGEELGVLIVGGKNVYVERD